MPVLSFVIGAFLIFFVLLLCTECGFELVNCDIYGYRYENYRHTYRYCPSCYQNIIQKNRNFSGPIMEPIGIKCPTCNHLFYHRPELTTSNPNVYHPELLSLSYSTYDNKENNIWVPCPNCGEARCTVTFTHPYVKCSWCDGVLNRFEGVAVYYTLATSYKEQIKIYLHKNCATSSVLNHSHLNAKLYSPSELAWAKFQWAFEYIQQGLFIAVTLIAAFLIVHLILQSTMKINLFPLFVIVAIAISVYCKYQEFKKDIEKNTRSTGKDW